MKVGLLCGGPSLERGISLNSARSVMDHLEGDGIELFPVYLDHKKNAYRISKDQLYSNTPSDFDFKLQQTAAPLRANNLIRFLKGLDIVFPVMHGVFGEDGGIQQFLERYNIPFVGSASRACKRAFDKFTANEFIKKHGFFALPSVVLKISYKDHKQILNDFFRKYDIKRAVVKPANGGSSIGVFSVSTPEEALAKVALIFARRMDTRVVVESFAQGSEFTMIILENRFGLPVALPPTEIEADYTKHQIFDFRKKYLPTRQVTWHCPPRFNDAIIEKIQAQGEQIFALLGMRDFGRFDGWVLPEGDIWFCDFNTISGMEQNSFLFQQASRVGMTHRDVLRYILERASSRYGITFPKIDKKTWRGRKRVNVVMGGGNSERQVSLMSGTNVWLKLRRSKQYEPHPYLLDAKGAIWRLPYHLCLNHTVEEITENCEQYEAAKARLALFEERARLHLGFLGPKDMGEFFDPRKLTLKKLKNDSDFIFIALHGGDGENGTMQKELHEAKVKFNGPGEKVSRLCMDKWATSNAIKNLHIKGISVIPGKVVSTKTILQIDGHKGRAWWREFQKELAAETFIVKPRADGCTSGVAHLYSSRDLTTYLKLVARGVPFISRGTFKGQLDIIEMPTEPPRELLFERFIETDTIRVRADTLKHHHRTGWIEVTIGVVEKDGALHAFNPSITVAEGEVLTVEEKFQGGTGVNITPPPLSIVRPSAVMRSRKLIETLARRFKIEGYARFDAFLHRETGELMVIEVNTLPGLTSSTVFFHQALTEKPPIYPRQLLELLIKNKRY